MTTKKMPSFRQTLFSKTAEANQHWHSETAIDRLIDRYCFLNERGSAGQGRTGQGVVGKEQTGDEVVLSLCTIEGNPRRRRGRHAAHHPAACEPSCVSGELAFYGHAVWDGNLVLDPKGSPLGRLRIVHREV